MPELQLVGLVLMLWGAQRVGRAFAELTWIRVTSRRAVRRYASGS